MNLQGTEPGRRGSVEFQPGGGSGPENKTENSLKKK